MGPHTYQYGCKPARPQEDPALHAQHRPGPCSAWSEATAIGVSSTAKSLPSKEVSTLVCTVSKWASHTRRLGKRTLNACPRRSESYRVPARGSNLAESSTVEAFIAQCAGTKLV